MRNRGSSSDRPRVPRHATRGSADVAVLPPRLPKLRLPKFKFKFGVPQLIICGILLVIVLVFIIYLNSVQAEPPLSLEGYIVRPYSRQTSLSVFQAQKIKMEATAATEQDITDRVTNGSSYSGVLTGMSGLNPARFPTSVGYAEDFCEINNTIMAAIIDNGGTITVGGTEFKGFWVLGNVLEEHGNACADPSTTYGGVLPTMGLEVTKDNIGSLILNLNIKDYFNRPEMYYYKPGYWVSNSSLKAFDSGAPNRGQGLFTMNYDGYGYKGIGTVTAGNESEWSIVSSDPNFKVLVDDYCPGLYEQFSNCLWGAPGVEGDPYYHTEGDRFSMVQAVKMGAACQLSVWNDAQVALGDRLGEYQNDYEKIAWLRMLNWLSYFYNGRSEEQQDLQIAIVKSGCCNEVVDYISSCVDEYLAQRLSNPRMALYDASDYIGYMNSEFISECAKLQVEYMHTHGYPDFKVSDAIDAFPYSQGMQGSSKEVDTGLYITTRFLFNYMCTERIYNEGGASNATVES